MKIHTLIILMLVIQTSISSQTINLQYNLSQGKEYKTEIKTKMHTQSDVQTINMNMNFMMDFVVDKVNKENIELNYSLVEVEQSIEMPNQAKMIYSSSKPANDGFAQNMHAVYSKVLNIPLITTLNNKGEITKTADISKILGGNSQMNTQVQNSMKEDFIVYPNKTLKIGDSWENSKTANGIGFKVIYTLKQINNNEVILDLRGKMDFSGSYNATIENTKYYGTVVIDKETGWLKTSNTIITMDILSQTPQGNKKASIKINMDKSNIIQ